MDSKTFFSIIAIMGSLFLLCTLFIGSTIKPEQAAAMKEGDSSSLTAAQHWAINIAMTCFYGSVALALVVVIEGVLKWLA